MQSRQGEDEKRTRTKNDKQTKRGEDEEKTKTRMTIIRSEDEETTRRRLGKDEKKSGTRRVRWEDEPEKMKQLMASYGPSSLYFPQLMRDGRRVADYRPVSWAFFQRSHSG